MVNIPDDDGLFMNVVLPGKWRFEKIANSQRHPLRLYANSVLTELYQMEKYYVNGPEDEFKLRLEAGLLIAKLEN